MVQSYKMTKIDHNIDMREDILSLTEVDILKWVKSIIYNILHLILFYVKIKNKNNYY